MTSLVPTSFQVAVMTGVGTIQLRQVDTGVLAPGAALVKIEATAICTWEQRSYSGAQANKFPFVGGHEIAGQVVAFGPGYTGPLAVGDRVACGSASCGACPACWTGRDNLCRQHYAGAVTYDDAWGPGGFAEYKVHPADGLYPIGDAPALVAALTEPLSCAFHAARLAGINPSATVVVIGAGVMGLMNVVAANRCGARVIVTEVDDQRLAMAQRLGAHTTINAAQTDPVQAVKDLTGGGADVVITAFGSGEANEQGLAMTARGGTLVLFASAHPPTALEIAPNKWHNDEKRLLGVVSSEKLDFYRAAQVIRYGLADLSPLVQNSYPLSEVQAALDEAIRPGTYRILVTP